MPGSLYRRREETHDGAEGQETARLHPAEGVGRASDRQQRLYEVERVAGA